MGEQKFHRDQRVKVVAEPYADDKDVAGWSGIIVNYSHVDAGDKVYAVRFVGLQGWRMIYERDLMVEDESVVLEAKKAKLQAEIEEIDKKLKEFHEDAKIKELTAGSVVYGPETAVVKVKDNWWHWYFIGDGKMQHHSNSDDKAVVNELKFWRSTVGAEIKIFPATED